MFDNLTVSIGKVPKIAACKAAAASSCSGSSSSGHKSASSPSTSKNKYSGGGNPVHPREIPVWQKEITCFFQAKNDELPLPRPSANDENEDDAVVEIPLQDMMQAGSSKM
ncbi:PREDICTED: PCNA-associated factor-like [Diuraphis noxia]|uniref:PCNA-associated factor-like n=1 Tax=Diuraphis noxia TaxID=143948 RepID=UPI000763A81E|nr:PREDICTED: PCNA-associated factor-like [Diuraphis noxia]